MPSGSHMTSGGSHFNGGGASHRGSSSSSHSSGSVRVRSGPMFIWIGRGRRAQVPARYSFLCTLIPFFLVVAFCLLLVGGFSYQDNVSRIKKAEVDRDYYLAMIAYAEQHPDYIVQGKVTGKFYNEAREKWFFKYEIPYTNASDTLEGQTFCVYSTEEIGQIHVNDIIQIAVDSLPITKDTDSVPMDYKDIPLESDGEFLQAQGSRNLSIGLLCGGGAAIVLVVVLAAVLFVKTKAEYNKNGANAAKTVAPSPSNPKPEKPFEEKKTHAKKEVNFDDPFAKDYFKCPNCGADVTADQKFCSICGEKLKK